MLLLFTRYTSKALSCTAARQKEKSLPLFRVRFSSDPPHQEVQTNHSRLTLSYHVLRLPGNSQGSTSALRATSTSKTGNEASSLRLSGGANGAVSGKGRSWVRTGTSTSTASTFVPGLSPAPAIYGPETDRGHQSQTRGLEYMESPSVERQATVTGDGVGRGAGIVRWGRGNRTMTLNEQHHEQHQQQEQQRKSATSEAVTDANASTSEKDASSRNRPNAPAPLDLSSLAGPAPPFRRKADSNASSAASSVSKPVVLQGAALESLQRLGRQRSAGSGGGSACSIRKGKYGGAARAADPYGRRSSRGFMHKSRSNSSRLLSSGGMENGFRTFDDQVDVSEGCPKISEEGRTKAVPGMTPGSDDKKSCAFEVNIRRHKAYALLAMFALLLFCHLALS